MSFGVLSTGDLGTAIQEHDLDGVKARLRALDEGSSDRRLRAMCVRRWQAHPQKRAQEGGTTV